MFGIIYKDTVGSFAFCVFWPIADENPITFYTMNFA